MKTLFSFTLFLLAAGFQYYLYVPYKEVVEEIPLEKDSIVTCTIRIVGDLMCHSTQFNYAHVEDDSFDFTGVYSEVRDYIREADISIGNLETVTAGITKKYSGYPFFNAPDDFLYALTDAGFDLLMTANNHAIDQGADGVERTINQLNKFNLHQTGTFISQEDKDSLRIFQVNGIRIAMLAYAEHTNGVPIPKGMPFIINLIDEELIAEDILKARKKGAEIVLVHFHYGPEYEREPSSYQQEVVNKTIELGADIIIGGHPHVIQPVDYFSSENGYLDTGFVAYSMGNFVSNQRWRYSNVGLILTIDFAKNRNTDSVYINNVSYLPVWVFRGITENGKEYIELPYGINLKDSIYSYLSKSDKQKMMQAFEDTKYIITKYTNNISLDSAYAKKNHILNSVKN
jgi:poly-gamma-glutamate synthesis protein (capsule biosynthesis protein)